MVNHGLLLLVHGTRSLNHQKTSLSHALHIGTVSASETERKVTPRIPSEKTVHV